MNSKYFAFFSLSLIAHSVAQAGELDIAASVNSNYTNSKVTTSPELAEEQESQVDTIEVAPSIGATFKSRKTSSRLTVDHRIFETRGGDVLDGANTESSRTSYTSYLLNSDISVIDNLLSIDLAGEQRFVPSGVNNNFISDEFLNSDSLTKTERYSGGFNFQLLRGDYLNFTAQGSHSKIKSGITSEDPFSNRIDSESQSLRTVITEGDNVDFMSWEFLTSFQKSNSTDRDDFITRRTLGNVYFGLMDDFQFLITGSTESNNGAFGTSFTGQSSIKFDTYGAGFAWSPKPSREIEITFNESKEQDGERETYVGARVNWQFSSRTSLAAEYGRRFFGRSGTMQFTYNTRFLRSSISYNELLTNFSTQTGVNADVQTFVCPIGETDVTFCFQPDTLNYELGAGEEFVPFASISPEITDEVRISKALRGTIGFQRNRLTSSLTFSHNDISFLESNRTQKTILVGLNNSLAIGRKTTLTLVANYQENDQVTDSVSEKVDTINGSFGATYRINPSLSSSLRYTYSRRKGLANSADIESERIALSINYIFN